MLEISLDLPVLGFAVGLSLLTGLVLGLIPALHASRSDPIDSLKDSRAAQPGGRPDDFAPGLLVAEVALSLVLLVGAVLLIDSFRRLQNVDPVFRAEGITTFFVGLPPGSYPDIEKQGLFFQNALEKIEALPGVTMRQRSNLPASDNGNTRSPAAVEGRPLPPVSDRTICVRSTISPGFSRRSAFRSSKAAISPGAIALGRGVVIINESMAKKFGRKSNRSPSDHGHCLDSRVRLSASPAMCVRRISRSRLARKCIIPPHNLMAHF